MGQNCTIRVSATLINSRGLQIVTVNLPYFLYFTNKNSTIGLSQRVCVCVCVCVYPSKLFLKQLSDFHEICVPPLGHRHIRMFQLLITIHMVIV